MPVYNCEKYVKSAIESILNQTYNNFEFLIINDGSTDNTKSICKSYNDNRIKFIDNERNKGIIESLNTGIDMATGKYIIRMDADDISLPNRFICQYNFMEANPDVIVCGTYFKIIGSDKIVKFTTNINKLTVNLLRYCDIAHPTVIIRNKTLKENNLKYDYNYPYAEDFEFWTRLINYGAIANIPKVLLEYRVHAKQVSNVNRIIQSKNTQLIKVKQLERFAYNFTNEEKQIYSKIVSHTPLDMIEQLNAAIKMLNQLKTINNNNQLYSKKYFNSYINELKKNCILLFYNFKPFRTDSLKSLFTNQNKYYRFFGFKNLLSYSLKCVLNKKS